MWGILKMAVSGITTTLDNEVHRVEVRQYPTAAVIENDIVVLQGTYGRIRSEAVGGLEIRNSQLRFNTSSHQATRQNAVLTIGDWAAATPPVNTINIVGSLFSWAPRTNLSNIGVSNITDTRFIQEGPTKTVKVYTQASAELKNVHFEGVLFWELMKGGAPAIVSGVTVHNCKNAIMCWHGATIHLLGFDATSLEGDTFVFGPNAGNAVYSWNSGSNLDFSKIGFFHSTAFVKKGSTVTWSFKDRDSNLAVNDVLLKLSTNDSGTMTEVGRYTTNASGQLVGTYNSKDGSTVASQVLETLFLVDQKTVQSPTGAYDGLTPTDPTYNPTRYRYDLVTVLNRIEVRSYLHEAPSGFGPTDTFTPTQIGKLNADFSTEEASNFILVPDFNLTESNKATVLAYTEIDTASKFYDRTKAEWRDNDGFPLVSKSGELIDLGAYNLTIDATASQAWAWDAATNTITIKANVYTGSLTTTGTLTLLNGATINGTVIDSTQDSTLFETNGALFSVFASASDRDARINAIATDVARYNFLLASIPSPTLYLWVRSGSTELPTEVAVVLGENVFDLGTAGVLNTLSNLIKYIPSKIYIDPSVAESGTGTVNAPIKTTQEVIDLVPRVGTFETVILSDLVLAQGFSGFDIEGRSKEVEFNFNSQNVNSLDFHEITLKGVLGGASESIDASDCVIDSVSGLTGIYKNCSLNGTLVLKSNSESHFLNCTSFIAGLGRPTIDLTGLTNVKLAIRGYKGGLTIKGSQDAANEITVGGIETKLTLDSTCTAGVISVRGVGQFTDNSTGATVDKTALVNTVDVDATNKLAKLIPNI